MQYLWQPSVRLTCGALHLVKDHCGALQRCSGAVCCGYLRPATAAPHWAAANAAPGISNALLRVLMLFMHDSATTSWLVPCPQAPPPQQPGPRPAPCHAPQPPHDHLLDTTWVACGHFAGPGPEPEKQLSEALVPAATLLVQVQACDEPLMLYLPT